MGFFLVVVTIVMLIATWILFDDPQVPGTRKHPSHGETDILSLLPDRPGSPLLSSPRHKKSNVSVLSTKAISLSTSTKIGLVVCIWAFMVHFEGFALQETITTPLVQKYYGWTVTEANYLFTGAGGVSLIAFICLRYVSRVISDFCLLISSFVFGISGYILLIDWNGLPLPRFYVGFALITIAFPIGRACVLAMYSKLLEGVPQGTYTGIMFAFGAVSRIAAPFFAVELFFSDNGVRLMFGASALLFVATLCIILASFKCVIPANVKDTKVEKRDSFHKLLKQNELILTASEVLTDSPRPAQYRINKRYSHNKMAGPIWKMFEAPLKPFRKIFSGSRFLTRDPAPFSPEEKEDYMEQVPSGLESPYTAFSVDSPVFAVSDR